MVKIEFIMPGVLGGTGVFNPSVSGVQRSIVDGRIRYNLSPAITFGRIDFASLIGFPSRDVVIYETQIANAGGPNVSGPIQVVGPQPPGGGTRNALTLLTLLNSPGIIQLPIWIPSGHLFGTAIAGNPLRLLFTLDQFQSGNTVNEWVRGQLTV